MFHLQWDNIALLTVKESWKILKNKSKLTIIGTDYGLSPNRHQAIILSNAGILLIGTLRTNFNEI